MNREQMEAWLALEGYVLHAAHFASGERMNVWVALHDKHQYQTFGGSPIWRRYDLPVRGPVKLGPADDMSDVFIHALVEAINEP